MFPAHFSLFHYPNTITLTLYMSAFYMSALHLSYLYTIVARILEEVGAQCGGHGKLVTAVVLYG